ncbi:MAG: RNA polymerase sigma factor [Phycisphaerales bacterium]
MDPEHTSAEFQTTHWSLVYRARGDRTVLEQLLRRYWSPVYAFIRRQGYGGHDASDLTQEFLARVVLGRDLIGKAEQARGRFRSFLKQALRNFLIDQHRTGRASRGRGDGRSLSTGLKGGADSAAAAALPLSDKTGHTLNEPVFTDEMSRQFDREWAATIIQATLQRMEDAVRKEDMEAHWTAFDAIILGPTLRQTSPIDLKQLGDRLGIADLSQISNMLQTMKRRFRRALREVVAETVDTPAQIEEELADLRALIDG